MLTKNVVDKLKKLNQMKNSTVKLLS